MHTDETGKSDTGMPVGLAFVAEGRVLAWTWEYSAPTEPWMRWSSEDYGQTWTKGPPIPLRGAFPWDQPTVERDPQTGEVTKIWETAYIEDHTREVWSQSYLRYSEDQGRTSP